MYNFKQITVDFQLFMTLLVYCSILFSDFIEHRIGDVLQVLFIRAQSKKLCLNL
jgi:hypothetical protein